MLKKYGLKIVVILGILLISAVFAYTHSGRTDRYGGHHDRINGGYHYHNSGSVGGSYTPTPSVPNLSSTPNFSSVPNLFSGNGETLYVPTQLEWLTLQLNAKYATKFEQLTGFFEQRKGEDTIVIEITYRPDASAELRNGVVAVLKQAIMFEATRYGWQDWVKIDVKMERFSN